METICNLIEIAVYIICLVYIAIVLAPDVKKALAIGNKELNYFKKVYLKAIDNNEKTTDSWWTTKKKMAAIFISDWFNNTQKTMDIDLCAIYYYLKKPETAIDTVVNVLEKNMSIIITMLLLIICGLKTEKTHAEEAAFGTFLVILLVSIAKLSVKKNRTSLYIDNLDKDLYISLCEAILKGTTEEKLVKLCSDYFDNENPDVVKDADATSFTAIFKKIKNPEEEENNTKK